MKRIFFLILIVGIFLSVVSAGAVYAQGVGLSISPVTFELTANPGDTLKNRIRVYNPSDSVIAVKMEIEDFTTTGELGRVIIEPAETETYSLANWIKVFPETFTLKPKEQKFVDFTIKIPENAEPGGKYGSILPSTAGVVGGGLTGSATAQKVGALLLLTVSGDVKEKLEIKEFSAPSFLESGPVPFTIKFKNTGTIHVRPRGFVTITKARFGLFKEKKVVDIEFPQLNVIPESVRKINVSWNEKWPLGKYTATLVGSYGTTNIPFNPPVLTFWVFPWKIAAEVSTILLLFLIFFYKTRKRWRLALRILFKGERKKN